MSGFMDWMPVLGSTLRDVAPLVLVVFLFQGLVLRRRPANMGRIVIGFVMVILGLSLFLLGLEKALFPLGRLMAEQLTARAFVGAGGEAAAGGLHWTDYLWVYLFAMAIGFATTIAEPALISVALKAHTVSAGAIGVQGLRLAVALGVAVGLGLGTFRIITGTPLQYYIIAGYAVVLLQTVSAPRTLVALAYDSGGVTTSTVTVPLVTALGLGLANNVPGRSAVMDGFGLIAFASLFPIMAVLAYAKIGQSLSRYKRIPQEE